MGRFQGKECGGNADSTFNRADACLFIVWVTINSFKTVIWAGCVHFCYCCPPLRLRNLRALQHWMGWSQSLRCPLRVNGAGSILEGQKKSSNESLRKKNLYTFGNRRVQKVLLHKIRSLENQTHQFRSFSLWWLPGWEVDLGTVGLVLVVPLFLLSAGRASRKESERKVPFWLMSASDTMGWHSTTHKHANIYKWSTANPITSFNKQTAAICTLGK